MWRHHAVKLGSLATINQRQRILQYLLPGYFEIFSLDAVVWTLCLTHYDLGKLQLVASAKNTRRRHRSIDRCLVQVPVAARCIIRIHNLCDVRHGTRGHPDIHDTCCCYKRHMSPSDNHRIGTLNHMGKPVKPQDMKQEQSHDGLCQITSNWPVALVYLRKKNSCRK